MLTKKSISLTGFDTIQAEYTDNLARVFWLILGLPYT